MFKKKGKKKFLVKCLYFSSFSTLLFKINIFTLFLLESQQLNVIMKQF